MNQLPKISIITPSLNQRQFITQAIDSVLSQGYPDLEYIVMDGGSTDGTLGILKCFERRLQLFSEPDNGQSHALNKGFRMATGEVIGFINTDDLYAPGTLSFVGKYFTLHPSVKWVTGQCQIIDSDGKEIRKSITFYKNLWLRLNSYTVLKVLNYISQPATFWRREVIEEIGYLDEDLHYAMEYDYWLRIGRLFPLQVVRKSLAYFRIHSSSKAGSSANAQFDAELEIARRYVRSSILLGLHELHRAIEVAVYQWMLDREHSKGK